MLHDSILHFFSGKNACGQKPGRTESKRKSLKVETLEDRVMLRVDFDSPLVSPYTPPATGVVNPSLAEHSMLFAANFDGNDTMDLLAIQSTSTTAFTYLNNGSTTSNAFSDGALKFTPSTGFITMSRAAVGKLDGDANVDLLTGHIMLDNVFYFSVFRGTGTSLNGGFYNEPINSNWSGFEALLDTQLGIKVPTNGTLQTILGNISLVERSDGRVDMVCTVSYNVWKADGKLYEIGGRPATGTLNLLFVNEVVSGKNTGKFNTAPTLVKSGSTTIAEAIVAAGDLTGNNHPDYVARNNESGTNKLDIYLSNTAGTSLTKYTTQNLGMQIGQVVVSKTSSGNKVIVALKDAAGKNYIKVISVSSTGSFTYSENYAVDIVPINIVTGDFNNDKTIDILISDGGMHQTLLGKGTTFEKQTAVIANADFMASYSADFNGDGFTDVLAVGKRFAWLIPGDPAKGGPRVVVDFAALGIVPQDVAFGKFIKDGKMDFAVLSAGGDKVYVFSNTSSGATASPTFSQTPTSTLTTTFGKQLLVANFDYANGDDIVVVCVGENATSTQLQTFLSAASGFAPAKTSTVAGTFDLYAVANITSTTLVDIVGVYNGNRNATSPQKPEYKVMPYIASASDPGKFNTTSFAAVPFGATSTNPTAMAIGDMNGDGRNDIVLFDAATLKVWIISAGNEFPGKFKTDIYQSPEITGLPTVVKTPLTHLALGDFNGDGVLDVLVGVWDSKSSDGIVFRVFENDSNNKGTLKIDANIISVGEFAGVAATGLSIHVGLLDQNATADVVIVGGNTVKRLLNSNKQGTEIGTVTLVFRDYNSNAELTYIDEWSTFYVEIWANTGSATTGIQTYESVITFDARYFEVRLNEVTGGTAFTKDFSFTKGVGEILLTGTVTGTGLQGNNVNVLLGRVAFRPSDAASVPRDYASGPKPMDNGFAVEKNTVTTNADVQGQSRYEQLKQVPLLPVIYDINGDGKIDATDYLEFVASYGKNISDPNARNTIRFCNFDIYGNGAQAINAMDYLYFAQNYGRTKQDFRADPKLKISFEPTFLSQMTPAAAAMQMALFTELVDDMAIPLVETLATMQQQSLSGQNPQNQALMAFIDSQETKKDDFDIDSLNPISETERLLAEGKL